MIAAREPEEKATTATMMVACVASSVFISKANFMPGANGEGGNVKMEYREGVSKGARVRGTKPGTIMG